MDFMADIAIDADGDLAVDERGDIGLTGRAAPPLAMQDAACIAQIARFALKTELGDLAVAPSIGSRVIHTAGLGNTPRTAAMGKEAIKDALRASGIMSKIAIEAWPETPTTIAYEVRIEIPQTGKDLVFVVRHEVA